MKTKRSNDSKTMQEFQRWAPKAGFTMDPETRLNNRDFRWSDTECAWEGFKAGYEAAYLQAEKVLEDACPSCIPVSFCLVFGLVAGAAIVLLRQLN